MPDLTATAPTATQEATALNPRSAPDPRALLRTLTRALTRGVFAKAVLDHRRGLLGWAVGVAAFVALYASLYPTYSTPEMAQTLETFPEGLTDAFGLTNLTTPEGYLQGTVFRLMGPLLLVVFAAARAGRIFAGEEEDGTLDLLLARPVSRTRLLLERFAALSAEILALGLIVLVVLLALAPVAELSAVPAAYVVAAVTGLVLLGIFFAALATAASAATGRRSAVLGAVAVAGVLTYIADTATPNVPALAWTQQLSPFYYASGHNPLTDGLSWPHTSILLGASLVLLGLAVAAFNHRDLAV